MADYSGDAYPAGTGALVGAHVPVELCAHCGKGLGCTCAVPPSDCTCRSHFRRTARHLADCATNRPGHTPIRPTCGTCGEKLSWDDECACTVRADSPSVTTAKTDDEILKMLVAAQKARQEADRGMRIMSDGTPHNTKVYFNGVEIPHVKSVSWRICYDELAHVDLEIAGVPVVVNAILPPEVCQVCAHCGESATHVCEPENKS